jgi:hypothetical protein
MSNLLFEPVSPLPRFNQTSKMAMSEGVTPEIRAAWPTVFGRMDVSFVRASVLRLDTVA